MSEEDWENPELKFFAARIPIKTIKKVHAAVKISGKMKQNCVADALEEWSSRIISKHFKSR